MIKFWNTGNACHICVLPLNVHLYSQYRLKLWSTEEIRIYSNVYLLTHNIFYVNKLNISHLNYNKIPTTQQDHLFILVQQGS